MAAKVFISYRQEDSAAYAGRIQDRLERELGRDLLFIDVDGIPLGVSFVKVLREEVAQCGVLLAVIGPNWFDMRDEDGIRRLDNPTDFVRIEIAAALQREIPVIPILLDGMSVRPEMCTDGSIGYSSPRRKRGSRACPWPEQGASAAALVPGFLLSQE